MQTSLTDRGGCSGTRRVGGGKRELQGTRMWWTGLARVGQCLAAGDPSSGVSGGWNFGVVAETVDVG